MPCGYSVNKLKPKFELSILHAVMGMYKGKVRLDFNINNQAVNTAQFDMHAFRLDKQFDADNWVIRVY